MPQGRQQILDRIHIQEQCERSNFYNPLKMAAF